MRKWISAIVMGLIVSTLVVVPASAEDAPGRQQVRSQDQVRVQEDECVADCDPLRDQEQERARLGTDEATRPSGNVGECGGDCEATDPDQDRIRDRERDQSRTDAPDIDDFEALLKRIRACAANGGDECPDPDAIKQRIRLMLADDEVPVHRLCLRLWNWWRIAL